MSSPVLKGSTKVNMRFLLVLTSDHITGATGITPTVTISKNGAAFASPSGAVTEISNGWYKVAGHATDTNTYGPVDIQVSGTGCDPSSFHVLDVVAYDPYVPDLALTEQSESEAPKTGVATMMQLLRLILQTQWTFTRTVNDVPVTVYKQDGVTVAATGQFDNGSNPVKLTRLT